MDQYPELSSLDDIEEFCWTMALTYLPDDPISGNRTQQKVNLCEAFHEVSPNQHEIADFTSEWAHQQICWIKILLLYLFCVKGWLQTFELKPFYFTKMY